jgi:hypothetical protein
MRLMHRNGGKHYARLRLMFASIVWSHLECILAWPSYAKPMSS